MCRGIAKAVGRSVPQMIGVVCISSDHILQLSWLLSAADDTSEPCGLLQPTRSGRHNVAA